MLLTPVAQVMLAQDKEAAYLEAVILRPATGARQLAITDFVKSLDRGKLIKGQAYGTVWGPYGDKVGLGLSSFSPSTARRVLSLSGKPRMELQVQV